MKDSKSINSGILNFEFSTLNFRRAGFTLLEVMIALAITGGLLVTLIYTLNYHLGIIERHETITLASLLAREKISGLEKSAGDSKGAFAEPYADYSYETEVKESNIPGISEISVKVKKGREEVRLSRLIPGQEL